MPQEFIDLELMIEWGLTPDQFNNLGVDVIGKIHEYRAAKSEGEQRAQAASKSKK